MNFEYYATGARSWRAFGRVYTRDIIQVVYFRSKYA